MVDQTTSRYGYVTLDQFNEILSRHRWSFQADSYGDLFAARKEEQELWALAQKLGIYGVDEFVESQQRVLREMRHTAYEEGHAHAHAESEHTLKYFRDRLEATRQKYMTPLDFFKEELDMHDWYYAYSDARDVYQRGAARQKELWEKAQAGGSEFVKAFEDKVAANEKAEAEQAERNRIIRALQTEVRAVESPRICEDWFLVDQVPGDVPEDRKDPIGLMIFYGPQGSGSTTRIVGFDGWAKRVKTESGSIYQLGEPNAEFAQTHRHVTSRLLY